MRTSPVPSRAVTFGTFDEYDTGHEFLLTYAKSCAHTLRVFLYDGPATFHVEVRANTLRNLPFVDEVVIVSRHDALMMIEQEDRVVVGYDQPEVPGAVRAPFYEPDHRLERSAGAVISSGDAFLLIRGLHGAWSFPKGHIERGESLKQAAMREVFEEVGVRIICEDRSVTFTHALPSGNAKEVTFFHARSDDRTVRINSEVLEYAWLPYDEVYERISFEDVREVFVQLEKPL